MKIPCLFNQCTIRQRLLLLNSLTAVIIVALFAIYSYQLISLEKKMIVLEQFDDLFGDILDLRRYEKDILLQLGDENVDKARATLDRVATSLGSLQAEVDENHESALLIQLDGAFKNYKTTFEQWCNSSSCHDTAPQKDESRLIRADGQKLVATATEVVRSYRTSIGLAFKNILFWLTFMPVIIFLAGAIVFFGQTRGILRRLDSLKQATKDLAAGEFKLIKTQETPDEISGLIRNFNQMVFALEQKQEQLIQSKKMATIGTFSSGIAHEINNPLNNISLSTDTLIEEYDSIDEEEIKEILDDIMAQTERASKIVRNLLDFSRAQSSEMEPIHIDFILHKTTELVANELRIHKISLHKKIEDLLPRTNGDLQKLQQVFLNLIINAEQAIGDYGIISVSAEKTDNGYVRVDISDTGPGIDPEHLEQIFDPFFTTKEAGKGTGLGLAIVYGIVKKHGGYIEVASKLGEGTTFSVYLPVYPEQDAAKTEA
jgi:signal transduction histidine kinase